MQQLVPLPVLMPQPQLMLEPMQAFVGLQQLLQQHQLQHRLEPEPMPMLQPKLMPLLGPKLLPEPIPEPEPVPELMLKPELMLELQLMLVLMLMQQLGLELIHQPKLAPIIQLVEQPQLGQQPVDQQLEQLLAMEFPIVEPKWLLPQMELLLVLLHHLKAFDCSKAVRVALDSIH